MRVFITGGTGLVGSKLVERLLTRGDQPVVLTRRPDAARQKWGERCTIVAGDPTERGAWTAAVHDCDAVVNLAGEGIFNRRWNAAFKEAVRASRVRSTENVAAVLSEQPRTTAGQPKVLVNASAIGYYGPHGDEELTEESAPGSDFLAQVCVEWEKAAQAAAAHGVRVVLLRIGVVLDPAGGALKKMAPPFKMFVGGPIASGRQQVSWIHIDDLVGLILFALDNPQVEGAVNATAPEPVSNREFSRAPGQALHRPSLLPAPAFGLRLMLGEAASFIIEGQRVVPRKAQALGYRFQFPEAAGAMKHLLQNPS